MLDLARPSRLHPGDKVAAITLSWGGAQALPARYALGKQRLRDLFGLELVETRHALRDAAWIAANPKARADDLMEAFADPAIKGVFSIIGGSDSVRLIEHVDPEVLRTNPKVFLGYSDSTVTHFICMKAGLSSFYGPSILAEFAENVACHPYTIDAVRRTLFEGAAGEAVEPSELFTSEHLDWFVDGNDRLSRELQPALGPRVLQGQGIVEGRLIGGCCEVLEMLRATPVWPEVKAWEGSILFLETSEERPPVEAFRRWVRGYGAMGILSRVKGIMLGRPYVLQERGKQTPASELTAYDKVLQEVVAGEFGLKDLPLMTQMDFGHTAPQCVLPYGRRAVLDLDRRQLFLPEAPVLG